MHMRKVVLVPAPNSSSASTNSTVLALTDLEPVWWTGGTSHACDVLLVVGCV